MSMIVRKKTEAAVKTLDWGQLTWYASADQKNSEDLTVGECLIKPGMSNPRHYHPNCSEVLVVRKGRIKHTVDHGEAVLMEEGDTITIPKDTGHNATNIGDSDAILIVTFSVADRKTIVE